MSSRDRGRFDPRRIPWRSIKPGWYLLVALLIYAVVATVSWGRTVSALRTVRAELAATAATLEPAEPAAASDLGAAPADAAATPGARGAAAGAGASAADGLAVPVPTNGLWFPVPGAGVPADDAHLPGAVRAYRQGVLQGFDFYSDDAGVPVPYGAAVIASHGGVVTRADLAYTELDPGTWTELIDAVAGGASEEQLDALRGRQLWVETPDGRVLRYAHLSAIRPGLEAGDPVYRGQVIGYVGNSGTDDGVAGTTRGARLHFEVWQDETFFGEGMTPDEVRLSAASLFVGP